MPFCRARAAHAHPAGGEGHHGIGKLARPKILQRARRAQHDLAAELGSIRRRHATHLAERHAPLLIEAGEPLHCAVHEDGAVVAGLAQQGHDPLRLA